MAPGEFLVANNCPPSKFLEGTVPVNLAPDPGGRATLSCITLPEIDCGGVPPISPVSELGCELGTDLDGFLQLQPGNAAAYMLKSIIKKNFFEKNTINLVFLNKSTKSIYAPNELIY